MVPTQVRIERKVGGEFAREEQLHDVGVVVVGFVAVVEAVARLVEVFSGGVVSASVFFVFHLLGGNPLPRDAGMLHAPHVAQTEQLPAGIVREGGMEVGMVYAAVADIAVAQHARVAHVERESAPQNTRSGGQRGRKGVVATHRRSCFAISFGVSAQRLQRNARPESGAPVGGGTHAALHLNALQRRRQIGQVHPIHLLAFGVVERHAVQRYVDAGGVCPADTHRRVAHTRTVFGKGNQRRNAL